MKDDDKRKIELMERDIVLMKEKVKVTEDLIAELSKIMGTEALPIIVEELKKETPIKDLRKSIKKEIKMFNMFDTPIKYIYFKGLSSGILIGILALFEGYTGKYKPMVDKNDVKRQ